MTKIVDCLGYKIVLGNGLDVGGHLGGLNLGERVFLISDDNVAPLHQRKTLASLEAGGFVTRAQAIPHGEASKSFAQFKRLCEAALDWGMGRDDTVVGLGGGVVGDLSGFVAASLLRGVNLVHLPTSLLAQVDSAIGGKTGINAAAGKNLVGSFYQPRLVLADGDWLRTLPAAELLSGYAEVVKHALIGDAGFFARLEACPPPQNGVDVEVIARSAEFKAGLVGQDEKECGGRALLNLGHTFAHALEAASGFTLSHGTAVAAGLAAAFKFSAESGFCPREDARRVAAHLRAVGFTIDFAKLVSVDPEWLLAFMRKDKKNRRPKGITLILARGIGEAFISPPIPEQEIAGFLNDI